MRLLTRIAVTALLGLVPLAGASAQFSPSCGEKYAAPEGEGLWERPLLTGNWGGARDRLRDAGVMLGMTDQNEFWGNAGGGARRGASYVGLTGLSLTVDPAKASDPAKAIGWQGLCVYISAYQIRGRGPTPNMVGALHAVSSLEATRAFRLYDFWAEQSLFDGAFSIRLGQGGANSEFMLNEYGALFANSAFGFPVLAALDLPSGAPNYPLATPFVRLKWAPMENLTLLGAVFNGDPAGPGVGDPQARNASGTLFRMRDSALGVMEAQLKLEVGGLSGTYKFGAWVHGGRFNDQAYDNLGNSLAAPYSSGVPRRHRGNHAFYGGFDQLVWKPATPEGTKPEDDKRGIGLFAMFNGAPGDRNLLNFSFTAGATWKGPFAGREEDALGIAVAYASLGARARQFGRDSVYYSGVGEPYQAAETVIEATYAAQVAPWWAVQPTLQYVIHPGVGIPSAASAAQRKLPNAVVFGLRSSVAF